MTTASSVTSSTTRPVAGGPPERTDAARPGAASSLLLAVLLVVVPTGGALAASSLPVPSPSAQMAPSDATSTAPQTAPTGAAAAPSTVPTPSPTTQPTTQPGAAAADCPSGLFGWVTAPASLDDCLAATLGSSVSWLFQYSVTTVTTYVAFNPLRGNYWQVYLWHFGLLSVVALVVALVQWLVSLVVDGAVEGMRSAGRSFVLLVVGLPVAFSVPFFVLLVDAGVLAVTGAFAGVFAGRVTELTGEVSSAALVGDTPGALLAVLLLTAFLFPLLLVMLFAFVLRQIAVYAIPVYGQFGLLPALAGDGGDALRTYFRLMAGTLLFPLQFVDLLVIGVSFLDFTTVDEGFVSLLYIIGVVLFALIGGSFLSLVFGVYGGNAVYAGSRRAMARRGRARPVRQWRPARSDRPSRTESTRLGAAAGARWDRRRDERDQARSERDSRRSRANPLYWLAPAAAAAPSRDSDAGRQPGTGTGTGTGTRTGTTTASRGAGDAPAPDQPPSSRTYGDRARERRGRRVGGSSSAPGRTRGRSSRGPRT